MDNSNRPQPPTQIGFISACIAGDERYTDTLKVEYHRDTRVVTVTVTETGAAGGMDGPGGRTAPAPSFRESTQPDPTAKDVLALVKKALAKDSFSFKRYGKPTQRFAWYTEDGRQCGVSLALCAGALERARFINKE